MTTKEIAIAITMTIVGLAIHKGQTDSRATAPVEPAVYETTTHNIDEAKPLWTPASDTVELTYDVAEAPHNPACECVDCNCDPCKCGSWQEGDRANGYVLTRPVVRYEQVCSGNSCSMVAVRQWRWVAETQAATSTQEPVYRSAPRRQPVRGFLRRVFGRFGCRGC